MALPRAASPEQQGAGWEDLDGITLEALSQEHDEYSKWSRLWADIRLLYRGGWEMLLASGTGTQTRAALAAGDGGGMPIIDQMSGPQNRRRRFLWQFEAEPDVKYFSVWERAQYTNYMAAVINYFRHWLFSKPAAIRPEVGEPLTEGGETEQPDVPPWYNTFAANCTGGGKNFDDFCKDAFLEVLLMRRAGWLVGRPPMPAQLEQSIEGQFISQREAEELGLTDSLLTLYTAEEIVDWQEDGCGDLLWVVLRKRVRVREFPKRRGDVEIYTYVDRARWATWRTSQDGGNKTLEPMGRGAHGLNEVPFRLFELPHDLWIPNQIHALAIQIFNRQNRLHTAEMLSCYPQPFLKSQDPDAKDRVMGEGIMLALRAGNSKTGQDPEEFGYAATPTAPYEFIKGSIEATVQELYRQVHQLSLAVDTKSVGSVARSGVSKQEDRKSIEVILAAFGGYVREAIVRTLNLVSKVQGDATEWSVEGFDDFDVSDLMDELSTATLVSALDIHSTTFKQEFEKRIATGRLMAQASPALRNAIEREITEFYEQQAEGAQLPEADPFGGMPPGQEPAAATEAPPEGPPATATPAAPQGA